MLNANAPGLPALSRADVAEAEGYLEHLLPVMPILGIVAFQSPGQARSDSAGTVLFLNRSGISARGRIGEKGSSSTLDQRLERSNKPQSTHT